MTELTKEKKLSMWGPGPWVEEPDHVEWRHNGVPCIAKRHPSLGHWCGYAAAEPGHPWHGSPEVRHGDVPDCSWSETLAASQADVHGGVTFEGACGEIPGVCHVPLPGESDHVLWIGFDMAHAGDYAPSSYRYGPSQHETYKTLEYVKAETEGLADQIIAARKGAVS